MMNPVPGSLFLLSLLAPQPGEQVAHSKDEVARPQDGDGGYPRLKVTQVETNQPGALFTQRGHQDWIFSGSIVYMNFIYSNINLIYLS